MTGQWMIGGVLAVLFESPSWTRLRWDFGEAAFLRSWHLTVLLMAGAMLLIWIDGDRINLVPKLLQWSPLLLLPVQFTQAYGLRDKFPLSTFSFFARKRWERNRKLGLAVYRSEINFGNIYLVVTVLASTLGLQARQNKEFFLAGLLLLTAWSILGLRRERIAAVILGLLFAGVMAVGGQIGLQRLYLWAQGRSHEEFSGSGPNNFQTSIGKLGEVKQSQEILWRLKTLQGATPTLLETSIYCKYDAGEWRYPLPAPDLDFLDLKTVEPVMGEIYYLANEMAGAEAIDRNLPRIAIRGSASSHTSLPVPGSVASLYGFDLDGIERNIMGTIRIFPKQSVIKGETLWSGRPSADYPPVTDDTIRSDLRVNNYEVEAARKVVDELGLRELPLREKLTTLRNFFSTKFRYTRYLTIEPIVKGTDGARTAMSIFLTNARSGHCEYFATAAALVLREAGVPTRYAVGFAVMERDTRRDEFVIRGTHGHAWCRVWDEAAGGWIDFDPTPGDWLGLETQQKLWYQPYLDWLLRAREDFFLWRNEPGNRLLGFSIILGIGLLGVGVVARSLWKSRQRLDAGGRGALRNMNLIRTPLHDLEPQARKLLGARSPGTPFGIWLAGLKRYLPDPPLLDAALGLHSRLRYDPSAAEGEDGELQSMTAEIAAALRGLKKRPSER